MYKVLFVDEENGMLDDFKDYVEESDSKTKLEVITQLPLESLEDMIEQIFKLGPDALITDFRLNEMKEDIDYNVPYNGVDLVQEFQSRRQDFPSFVLTAVDDEAVSKSDDVNIVYVKNIVFKKEEEGKRKEKASFLDRVFSQIEHYKSRIEKAKAELADLLQKREEGEANYEIEHRMIELDTFIEKSIDAKNSIPAEFKSYSNTDRLNDILGKVDELLKKID